MMWNLLQIQAEKTVFPPNIIACLDAPASSSQTSSELEAYFWQKAYQFRRNSSRVIVAFEKSLEMEQTTWKSSFASSIYLDEYFNVYLFKN